MPDPSGRLVGKAAIVSAGAGGIGVVVVRYDQHSGRHRRPEAAGHAGRQRDDEAAASGIKRPHGPSVMIGERGADLILRTY
jgi:hypothetical protein